MYLEFRKDGELNELRNPELDWYREYIYDEKFLPIELLYKD